MDDIILEKILHDGNLIELNIVAESELVKARQSCYIDSAKLGEYSAKLQSFVLNSEPEVYVQFGEKEGNHTPAFSMKVIRADRCGHVKVEMDVEVEDNDTRAHRCCFYVNSDIGAIEHFGMEIGKLESMPIGEVISLNNGY